MKNKFGVNAPTKGLGMGYKLLLTPEIGILIPILILCIITSVLAPNFLTYRYMASILTGSIFIGAAALGEALIIMVGEIDLSVGMSGALSGVMCGIAAAKWGCPAALCLLIGMATGALVGLVNGLCVSRLNLTSWIATLATQFICNGFAVTIAQGEPLSISSLGLSGFTRARPLGLTWLFFLFLAVIVLLDIVVRKTKFGYKMRAVGGNKDAALMAGIDVKLIKMFAFVIAGALAAMGGLFDVLSNGSASDAFGAGREFRAIICCAIGGISMTGGSGSIYGAGLGVLLFHTLWYSLRILNMDTNLQLVLIGLILIAAVLMENQRKRMEINNTIFPPHRRR